MEILVRLVICQEGIKLFGLISFSLPNLRESTNTVDIFIQPLSNHIQMCQLLDFFFFFFTFFHFYAAGNLFTSWEGDIPTILDTGREKKRGGGGMEKKRERNIGEIAEVSCFLAFSFSQDLQMWHCFQSLSSQVILPKEEKRRKGDACTLGCLQKMFGFLLSIQFGAKLPCRLIPHLFKKKL